MNSWDSTITANGISAAPRGITRDKLFDAWDSDEFGNTDGVLSMVDCPFHPVAITLRIDLRNGSGYSSGNAGEARIVYSFVDDSCNAGAEGLPRDLRVLDQ